MNHNLEYLTAHLPDMLATLEVWVNHDSPTFDKPLVDALGRKIADAFAALGASVETQPQSDYGDHLRIAWGQGDRQILLLGHFDTVWPGGEVARRPFTVRDGKATGPGVNDMKGGILIGLYALRALIETAQRPAHRLVYLFTSDEENGSLSSRELIEAEARRSDYVLVLEPARHGSLITWRKGIGRFSIEVTGVAAHSGVDPEKGVSAIEEMAHQILKLQAMTDLARGTTVNVGVVQGGSRVNVIAASARAECDLRVMTLIEGERMQRAILGLSPVLKGTSVQVSGGINRPPFEETEAGLALFERARAVGARLGLDLDKTGTGGGTDGNFTAGLGVPTLDGLGVVGEGSHALHEQIWVNSLPERAALLAELILDLGQG
ncbi:MAG: M20 family metallopeptidase [Anaerolineae bacterium]